MKKFIIRLIYFSIPLILYGGTLEYFARRIPNDYALKRQILENNNQTIEILILGSSHALYGIDPQFLSRASVNAAHVSQSLNIDLMVLEKYFSNSPRLKVVILPISYFTLFTSLDEGPEKWRMLSYAIYHDIHITPAPRYKFEIFGNSSDILFTKLKAYYKKKKNPITCSELGWGNNFTSAIELDLVESGLTRSKIHTVENNDLLEQNRQSLVRIQQFLKDRNIKLFLFTPPAYETYTKHLDQQQLDLSIQIPEALAAREKNTFYTNLLYSAQFTDADYFDGDHLNEIGARKLTGMLDKMITDRDAAAASGTN